jgi:hypothetical protein
LTKFKCIQQNGNCNIKYIPGLTVSIHLLSFIKYFIHTKKKAVIAIISGKAISSYFLTK